MAISYIPYFISAFLAGVAARSFFNIPENWILIGLGACVGIFAIFYFALRAEPLCFNVLTPTNPPYSKGDGEDAPLKVRGVGGVMEKTTILLMIFLFGMLRFSIFENKFDKDGLHNYYGREVVLRGEVVAVAEKIDSSRIVLETEQGKVLVVKRIYPRYRYGDILDVSGKILEPELSPEFDEKNYLAKDGVYSKMIFPNIKFQGYDPQSRVRAWLFSARSVFEENITKILPEPHASLAKGMLLGSQGSINTELLSAFQKSGTVHILVLSGYNIMIVGVFVWALISYFTSSLVAVALSIFGISVFTIMSGAEAAAVRAAIMATISFLTVGAGRPSTAGRALLLAAFLMLLWNPMLLRFDGGFQLSFLATLGLILAADRFKKALYFLPKFLGVRESAASSIAAQLFVVPMLIYWGRFVSFLSPVANILIVTIVPMVMLFSFLGGLAASFSVFLGRILAAPAFIAISYQIFIAKFFANIF